jgi:hypothetical protein
MNSRCETKVTYCFSHCNLFVRIESVNFQDNVSYRHRFGDGGGGFSGRAGGFFAAALHPMVKDNGIIRAIGTVRFWNGSANPLK